MDADKQAIEKLRHLIDALEAKKLDQIEIFNADEVAKIRKVISVYESFESFGKLAGAVRQIVLWFGVMIGAYYGLKQGFGAYIQSLAGR